MPLKNAIVIILIISGITGCIHRTSLNDYPKECSNIRTPSNLHLKIRTRIKVPGNKVILIQHIFIKDNRIRIDTMGAFDDIIMSILVKEKNAFVIHFQQRTIYRFTSEEEFYRISGLYLPIFDLPLLLTLSEELASRYSNSKQDNLYIDKKREIRFIRDDNSCRIRRVEIISPLSGDISAHYYDFSLINGEPIFHRLIIQNKKQQIEADIKVLKVSKEEIREEIFDTNIKGFGYVTK